MAREAKHIVIHCSATPPSADIGVLEIKRWHRDRGFRDVGYHFVIRRNGDVQRGRSLNKDSVIDAHEVGAHVAGHNAATVGVCLVGGVDAASKPEANFTPAQVNALRKLLADLKVQFPNADVRGHNDFTGAKACPSFKVGPWVAAGMPDNLVIKKAAPAKPAPEAKE